ncbi:MAG: hypothetical protein LUC98_07005 [Lachnospiraceae bacterium]|nr:hypothetical protein [Lachnospiraceae bacterium]
MRGLEKITDQIQEEAKAAAAERIRAAQREADELLVRAREECAALEAEGERKSAAARKNYESRMRSSAEQQRRTALLAAKQEIIAEVLDQAYATLKNEDVQSYFLTMEKLLKTYELTGAGEIYFSEADLGRMPRDFEKKIHAAALEKGGSLVLHKEPKNIEDGFILVYGGVEENCTLRALFHAKRGQLQDKVNEILFL